MPSTGLDELYDVFGMFTLEEGGGGGDSGADTSVEGIEMDWPLVLAKMDRRAKGELNKWLRRHAQRGTDMETVRRRRRRRRQRSNNLLAFCQMFLFLFVCCS